MTNWGFVNYSPCGVRQLVLGIPKKNCFCSRCCNIYPRLPFGHSACSRRPRALVVNAREEDTTLLEQIKFDCNGLVPVIAQQHDTGEVLMLAWMNREAITTTLQERRVCYYSRSRKALWRKGETSGQVQWLKDIYIDCDGDTVLIKVDQTGVACHTGRRSCFFTKLNGETWDIASPVEVVRVEHTNARF